MRLTTDEKNFIVKKYAILGSPVLVQRAWRTKYVCKYAPNGSTITALVKKFDKTGAVHNLIRKNKEPSQKRKNAKTKLKIVISEDPSLSIRQISQDAEISYSLTRLILKDDLDLKPYKLPDFHELEPADFPKRLDFCNWVKVLPRNAADWFIFSDEAYFYLTKTANKQNSRLWLETRPKSGIERPLYDQKVLVWCAMSSQRIYGPYFFETTVNQNNYHNMLVKFFWPKVVREDYKNYYFQQDGATPHTSKKAQKYLRSKFGDKFIDNKKWPPRSPDLNPCDYFLWGYLKSRVYNPLPKNLDDLKTNIEREIKNINTNTLKNAILNFSKRCDLVIEAKGGHIDNLL